jgi:hypothetical protein
MEFQKCMLEQTILFCLLNENNDSIPLKYLEYFLTKEKFPFKYGFKLTNRLNTFNLLKNYTKLLYKVNIFLIILTLYKIYFVLCMNYELGS